jgi:SAM-dependent methyltransferase/uncharacterized protein YbaR (Trm112 family)
MNGIDDDLLKILRCPATGLSLQMDGDGLVSTDGTTHYPVINGIPCLIPASVMPTHVGYEEIVVENEIYKKSKGYTDEQVQRFLDEMLVPTIGNLFRGVRLSGDYPIPDFSEFSLGGTVLDVGCSWGRWSMAGAKAGHRMIGVDIQLESLFCARRLAQKLVPSDQPYFVLADARYLPFSDGSFDGAFSYSVIQHFSKTDAAAILGEIKRVMKHGAQSVIQMPNKKGIGSIVSIRRSHKSECVGFGVRYYSIDELISMFGEQIGKSEWFVDCFFGLNVHARDRKFVPAFRRWIIDIAELFLRVSRTVPVLGRLSDSIFVRSTKS